MLSDFESNLPQVGLGPFGSGETPHYSPKAKRDSVRSDETFPLALLGVAFYFAF